MNRLERRIATFVSGEPELSRTARLAGESGCRILLVGGAVRDLALGLPVRDVDFILDGAAHPFLRRLSRYLGRRVVTFRKRGVVDHRVRSGRREWDFVERGPRSLRREILRRDFSINAIAFDPLSGRLLDPGSGLADLARRRIRSMSDGVFRDDPLRMLRAVRLQAEIEGLAIGRHTAAMIRRDARLITRASPERIKSEIDRILATPRASRALRALDRLGLLRRILPELDPLRGLVQNRWHHLDAFHHTLGALAAADDTRRLARALPSIVFLEDPLADPAAPEQRPPATRGRPITLDLPGERARLLRWALLLHDTGKAETRTLGEDGEFHFYLHERASSRIARTVFRRLRAARSEIASVERLVALHLRLSIPATGEISPRALRRIVRDAGSLTPLLVLHSLADKLASKGPAHARTLSRLREAGRLLLETWRSEEERSRRLPRLVDGHDVQRLLRVGPGPHVGETLAEVEDLQLAGELTTREQALDWLTARLVAGKGPADPDPGERS